MKYLTTEEVAERFRTSQSTIRYWRHIGKGPRSVKYGRRPLYPVDEVERYEAAMLAEQHREAA